MSLLALYYYASGLIIGIAAVNLVSAIVNFLNIIQSKRVEQKINDFLYVSRYTWDKREFAPSFMPGEFPELRGVEVNGSFYSLINTDDKYKISNVLLSQGIRVYQILFPIDSDKRNFVIVHDPNRKSEDSVRIYFYE